MQKEQVRLGSTRQIVPVRSGVVDFVYTDKWSVFDRGPSPQEIPGLGGARCACAVKSFELAHEAGIETHFFERIDERTIRVQEFSVPGSSALSGVREGRVLPLEWIWRDRVYGSLYERLVRGTVSKESLGFGPHDIVEKGTRLPALRQECTTKFESVDRHLSDENARLLAGLSPAQWEEAKEVIRGAIRASNDRYNSVGFMCPDGKLELGRRWDGTIVLVDVFGTPDENRIIRKSDGEVFSKDLLRDYLKEEEPVWKTALDNAKLEHPNQKELWPEYPELPQFVIDLVSDRYREVAEAYAGS